MTAASGLSGFGEIFFFFWGGGLFGEGGGGCGFFFGRGGVLGRVFVFFFFGGGGVWVVPKFGRLLTLAHEPAPVPSGPATSVKSFCRYTTSTAARYRRKN